MTNYCEILTDSDTTEYCGGENPFRKKYKKFFW